MRESPLVVVLAVGYDETPERAEYKKVASGSIKKYYDHFGIPCEVMHENHPAAVNTSPSMARLLLFDLYPKADFILAQGLDMLPCNYRYNIQDFLCGDVVNMAVDCTRAGQYPKPCSFPNFKYNADLLGYPKALAPFMKRVFIAALEDKLGYSAFEQYYLNDMLWNEQIYVNDLPIIFNKFYSDNFDYEHTVFCHYTNHMASKDKYEYILQYHPKEML